MFKVLLTPRTYPNTTSSIKTFSTCCCWREERHRLKQNLNPESLWSGVPQRHAHCLSKEVSWVCNQRPLCRSPSAPRMETPECPFSESLRAVRRVSGGVVMSLYLDFLSPLRSSLLLGAVRTVWPCLCTQALLGLHLLMYLPLLLPPVPASLEIVNT